MPPSGSPAVVCAWCGRVIQPGTSPASHSICPECQDRVAGEGGNSTPIPQSATPNFTQK